MAVLTLIDSQYCVRIEIDLSEPNDPKKGLRKGDVLACLSFNVAL
jgi:hypothetical protein